MRAPSSPVRTSPGKPHDFSPYERKQRRPRESGGPFFRRQNRKMDPRFRGDDGESGDDGGVFPVKRIESVNDFVVKFSNVNGSGSASANELFARAFLRMGIPVSPRNIFPSNIQGLPTWYEVRVTEKG